jgi:hypothetical protein
LFESLLGACQVPLQLVNVRDAAAGEGRIFSIRGIPQPHLFLI